MNASRSDDGDEMAKETKKGKTAVFSKYLQKETEFSQIHTRVSRVKYQKFLAVCDMEGFSFKEGLEIAMQLMYEQHDKERTKSK